MSTPDITPPDAVPVPDADLANVDGGYAHALSMPLDPTSIAANPLEAAMRAADEQVRAALIASGQWLK